MITVVGESLVDVVCAPDGSVREHPGGSPANVALGLARLGHDAALVTQLADDPYGRLVREHLESSGVAVEAVPTERTSVARAALDERGAATYTFDLAWDVPGLSLPPATAVLHTGSLATLVEPGAAAVEKLMADAAAAGVVVSFDPNSRPALVRDHDAYVAQVERLVAKSHVVKVSDEDLAYLYPDVPDDERAVLVASQWYERVAGPGMVVVTLGPEGALAVAQDSIVRVPGRRIQLVDTVGAGDAFTSGLLDGIASAGALDPAVLATLPESAVTEVVERAVLVAGITCSRPGADPPTRADVVALDERAG